MYALCTQYHSLMKSRTLPWLPLTATLGASIPIILQPYPRPLQGTHEPMQPQHTHPRQPFSMHPALQLARDGQVPQLQHSCTVAASTPRCNTAYRMGLPQPPRARRAYCIPRRDTDFARLSFFRLFGRPCTESRVDPQRDQTGGSGGVPGFWSLGVGSARYKTNERPTVLLALREKQLLPGFILPFKPSPNNYSSLTISLAKANPLIPNSSRTGYYRPRHLQHEKHISLCTPCFSGTAL